MPSDQLRLRLCELPHDVLAELAAQLCSESTTLQATAEECLAAHKPLYRSLSLWAVECRLVSPDLAVPHIVGPLVAEDAAVAEENTLDGMWRAVEQSDWMTHKRDAHSLKGTSGHVAAVALMAAAEALERSANASLQGSDTSPKEVLANVEREIDRVLVAIEEATGEPLPLSAPPLSTGLAGASGASAAAVPTYAPALAPAAAPATASPAAPAPAHLPAPAPAPATATAPVAPRSAHATPAINLNDVLSAVGGSEAVMARLLTKFCERAEATLDGMRRAIQQNDWMTLKRDAHSLKGASGYVAAVALKAAAEALKRSANESLHGSGASPAEALAHVEREMARVLIAIEEATGEAPGPHSPPLGTGVAGASGASAAAVPTVTGCGCAYRHCAYRHHHRVR